MAVTASTEITKTNRKDFVIVIGKSRSEIFISKGTTEETQFCLKMLTFNIGTLHSDIIEYKLMFSVLNLYTLYRYQSNFST